MFKLLITLLSIVFLITFIYSAVSLVKYFINQGQGNNSGGGSANILESILGVKLLDK